MGSWGDCLWITSALLYQYCNRHCCIHLEPLNGSLLEIVHHQKIKETMTCTIPTEMSHLLSSQKRQVFHLCDLVLWFFLVCFNISHFFWLGMLFKSFYLSSESLQDCGLVLFHIHWHVFAGLAPAGFSSVKEMKWLFSVYCLWWMITLYIQLKHCSDPIWTKTKNTGKPKTLFYQYLTSKS